MDTQSSQVLIQKNIIMENQLSGNTNTFSMRLQYIPQRREVNMSRAFREMVCRGLNLSNSQIFYMDCDKRAFVYLGIFPSKQEIFLGYQYMLDEVIRIRFKKTSSESKFENETKKKQKRKVKERTIKEVIDSVNQWRELYDKIDLRGKRIHTLQSAAQLVGIAKKTLDDYYAHLRLARSYGFDFEAHKYDKIGVLRQFVKACQLSSANTQNITTFDTDQFWASSSSDSDEDKLF